MYQSRLAVVGAHNVSRSVVNCIVEKEKRRGSNNLDWIGLEVLREKN